MKPNNALHPTAPRLRSWAAEGERSLAAGRGQRPGSNLEHEFTRQHFRPTVRAR